MALRHMPVRLVEDIRPTAATLSAGVATPQAEAGPPAAGEDEDGGEAAGSRHLARPVSEHIASPIKYYFILMYIKTKPK